MLGFQGDVPAGDVELTLVRHGRTEWHAENRYAGVTDLELDDVGREQARTLAAWVREHPHDAVACSPLRRARQTAEDSAAELGVRPEVVPELREVDFGIAEGRTLAELRDDEPELAAAFVTDPVRHPFPGAEPPEQAATRVRDGLRALADRHRGGSVLVVGHNTALRLALCSWLGIAVARYRDVLPRLDNVAVTRLRVATPTDPDRPPALLCLNASLTPEPVSPRRPR
ncbi:histidine phosphatase family protein [Pseudonocardia acaciae]|uniref:histidine phosphatase family protein n=1 Tax=Pseudonocardia acaciae TaxID=551276 RepID=UPI000A69B0E6|nr:histidine phosphatase family protein [Pseudonocardia acaciae]